METQPKTPEKRGKIVNLKMSPLEIPSKKKGENRRSSDIFFRDLNRRSVRKRIISAKESYIEINKIDLSN